VLGEDRADVLERLLVEAVLECERLELGGLDASTLLRVGDQLVERSDLMCRFQRCLLGVSGVRYVSGTSTRASSKRETPRIPTTARSRRSNTYNGDDGRSIPV
jgi:hypothetical protein